MVWKFPFIHRFAVLQKKDLQSFFFLATFKLICIYLDSERKGRGNKKKREMETNLLSSKHGPEVSTFMHAFHLIPTPPPCDQYH